MKWYIWPTIELYLALNNVSLSLLNLHSTFYSKRNFFSSFQLFMTSMWSLVGDTWQHLTCQLFHYLFIYYYNYFLQGHSQPYKIKNTHRPLLESTCHIVKSLCAPIKMSIYFKKGKKNPFIFYVRKWKLIKTKTSFHSTKFSHCWNKKPISHYFC